MVWWVDESLAQQFNTRICYSPCVKVGRKNTENLPIKTFLASAHSDRSKINLSCAAWGNNRLSGTKNDILCEELTQAKVDTHEDERKEINGTNEAQEYLVFSQDLVDGGEPRGDDGQGPGQGGQ